MVNSFEHWLTARNSSQAQVNLVMLNGNCGIAMSVNKRTFSHDIATIALDGPELRRAYDAKRKVLTVPVRIMRVGVLPYSDGANGVRWELKHPDDFHSDEFLATVPGRPVIDGHPAMIDEFNMSEFTKGVLHDDHRIDGDHIKVTETVFHKGLIEEILDGDKREVSTGVWVQLVEEEGVFDEIAYTHRQVNPRLNHLAHVPQGRCGPSCQAIVDARPQFSRDRDSHIYVQHNVIAQPGGQSMTGQPREDVQLKGVFQHSPNDHILFNLLDTQMFDARSLRLVDLDAEVVNVDGVELFHPHLSGVSAVIGELKEGANPPVEDVLLVNIENTPQGDPAAPVPVQGFRFWSFNGWTTELARKWFDAKFQTTEGSREDAYSLKAHPSQKTAQNKSIFDGMTREQPLVSGEELGTKRRSNQSRGDSEMEKFTFNAGHNKLELPLCDTVLAAVDVQTLENFQGEIRKLEEELEGYREQGALDEIKEKLASAESKVADAEKAQKAAEDALAQAQKGADGEGTTDADVEKLTADLDKANADLKAAQDEVSTLQGTLESKEDKITLLEQQLAEKASRADAEEVTANLIKLATSLDGLIPGWSYNGQTARQMKIDAINASKKVLGKEPVEGLDKQDDLFIDAAFDGAVDVLEARASQIAGRPFGSNSTAVAAERKSANDEAQKVLQANRQGRLNMKNATQPASGNEPANA